VLQDKKKEMARIIGATNAAFETRERCIADMAALKAQADKEQAAFEEEWKRLGALIDDDRRMRELQRQREMDERDRKTQEVRDEGWRVEADGFATGEGESEVVVSMFPDGKSESAAEDLAGAPPDTARACAAAAQ